MLARSQTRNSGANRVWCIPLCPVIHLSLLARVHSSLDQKFSKWIPQQNTGSDHQRLSCFAVSNHGFRSTPLKPWRIKPCPRPELRIKPCSPSCSTQGWCRWVYNISHSRANELYKIHMNRKGFCVTCYVWISKQRCQTGEAISETYQRLIRQAAKGLN